MLVRIQKWGNSLGLRIPAAFAREVGLEQGSEVDLALDQGRLVLTPRHRCASLEEMVGGITEENLHGEIPTGPPTGREAW